MKKTGSTPRITVECVSDLKQEQKIAMNKAPQMPQKEKKKEEAAKIPFLYQDEKDNVLQLIKRIVYAEGDYIKQNNSSIVFLKAQLVQLVGMFTIQSKQPIDNKDSLKKMVGSKRVHHNHKDKKMIVSKKNKKSASRSKKKFNSESESSGEEHHSDENGSEEEYYSDGSESAIPHRKHEAKSTSVKKIDVTLMYYVFDNIIQRYIKLKKSIKDAKKNMMMKACDTAENNQEKVNLERDEDEELFSDTENEDNDSDEANQNQMNVSIVDIEDILRYKQSLNASNCKT